MTFKSVLWGTVDKFRPVDLSGSTSTLEKLHNKSQCCTFSPDTTDTPFFFQVIVNSKCVLSTWGGKGELRRESKIELTRHCTKGMEFVNRTHGIESLIRVNQLHKSDVDKKRNQLRSRSFAELVM